ncbi:amidase signature domain-containing protein [Cladochytrium replicatum]|nr:amidase signature domain-containing protein [Cladochytrium replicatum]
MISSTVNAMFRDDAKIRKQAQIAKENASVEYSFSELAKLMPAEVVNLILELPDIDSIVSGIRERQFSAEDVMRVTCIQALKAHAKVNCITENMMESAMLTASALDERYSKTQKLVGPLHGVPIALKDNIDVQGHDSSLGCRCSILQPKARNSPIVEALLAAGAIPFCKTNVPWHVVSGNCANSVWGRTLNPIQKRISPGGSSGGLAALLAAGGALIGIGTDEAGGLRVPAQNCRLFALKPTSNRLPGSTTNNFTFGWDTIPVAVGPMTRSLNDLVSIFKGLVNSHPENHDPATVPLPFNTDSYNTTLQSSHAPFYDPYYNSNMIKLEESPIAALTLPSRPISLNSDTVPRVRPLRIGYFTDDGFFRSTPPATSAILQTVYALRQQGHHTIPFALPPTHTAMELMTKMLMLDRSSTCTSSSMIYESELDQGAIPLVAFLGTPHWARSLVAGFFERVLNDKVLAMMIRTAGTGGTRMSSRIAGRHGHGWGLDTLLRFGTFGWWKGKERCLDKCVTDVQALKAQREEYQRFFAERWNKDALDILICPVHAIPPTPSRSFPYTCAGASYSMLFNFLDYPVGIIPGLCPITRNDRVRDVVRYVHSGEPYDLFPIHMGEDWRAPSIETVVQKLQAQEVPAGTEHIPRGSYNFLAILGTEEYNARLKDGSIGNNSRVGIQVVGRRYEEEKVLAAMQVISDCLQTAEARRASQA